MTDPPTIGAILAGGLARRLGGGDKALQLVGGRTVLARLIERLSPQVARLILNANQDPARFAPFGLPVVPDGLPGHPGPLAGVLAALDWAAAHGAGAEWVVTVPGDCPFIPLDLAARLHAARAREGAQLAAAASGGRTHPVIGLWPVALRAELRHALVAEDTRKIDAFTGRYRHATVSWPAAPVDPFFNVNTPGDLAEADRIAEG